MVRHAIVIGAMKAGTTTLYNLLSQHPQISVSNLKETDFFLKRNFHKGPEWYERRFDHSKDVSIDVSPNYVKYRSFPGVAERVRDLYPDVKLIFIARDPVERAISQYKHQKLQVEGRLGDEKSDSYAIIRHAVEVSSYGEQIDHWYKFFNKEQFLFIEFETMIEGPRKTIEDVCAFLGVENVWQELTALGTSNSSLENAVLPSWLYKMRSTGLGKKAKELLPRGAVNRLKATLSGKPNSADFRLEQEILDAMKVSLRTDIQHFRKITGVRGSGWVV